MLMFASWIPLAAGVVGAQARPKDESNCDGPGEKPKPAIATATGRIQSLQVHL